MSDRYVTFLEEELTGDVDAPAGFVYCLDHQEPELIDERYLEDHDRLHLERAVAADPDQESLFA